VILGGGELWAVAASAAVRLAAETYLVRVAYHPFLQRLSVAARSGPSAFSWSAELLPLQWKIGVQAVAAYFLWTAYTPIISKYYGLELGGRMGMTLQAISTIQLVALAWIQTRVPRIGSLLAHGDDREAQQMFRSMLAACMGVYVAGSAAFLALILILQAWKPPLAARVLNPLDVVLFEVGMGLTLLVSALATYVRSHKIDPFLWVGLFNAAVTAALVWHFGKTVGPRGAALAHIGVTLAIMLPATVVIYRSVAQRAATHRTLPPTHSPHSGADILPD
jgi:O-antigen/teichoic acid export membrane protein